MTCIYFKFYSNIIYFFQIIFLFPLKIWFQKKFDPTFTILKAEIFAPAYLISKEGNYKGYPFRPLVGDTFTNGYSDHFPVFVVLQKEYNP